MRMIKVCIYMANAVRLTTSRTVKSGTYTMLTTQHYRRPSIPSTSKAHNSGVTARVPPNGQPNCTAKALSKDSSSPGGGTR